LGYGVIAGPFYLVVSLAQALTRDGFDLSRHPWSLLSNGGLGWIHITNFVLTGLMVIAFAVGLRRVLLPGLGGVWAPRLVAVYGAGMIASGVLRADPAMGFPAGTPDGPAAATWHGTGHLIAGGIGFLCLIAACFVIGRRFSAEGRRGWAAYSRATGVMFFAAFAGIASGGGAPAGNFGFIAGVVLVWAWMSRLALHLYRVAASTGN
jgi:hypothetical protein